MRDHSPNPELHRTFFTVFHFLTGVGLMAVANGSSRQDMKPSRELIIINDALLA